MTLFQNMRSGTLRAQLTVDALYELTVAGVLAEQEPVEPIDGHVVPIGAGKVTLSPNTLVEPDLAVWDRDTLPRQVRGPDLLWLIEVADSSIADDLRIKAPYYANHGGRDDWVVDAVRQTIRVHRAPVDGAYANVEEYGSPDSVDSLLAGVTLRLDTLH